MSNDFLIKMGFSIYGKNRNSIQAYPAKKISILLPISLKSYNMFRIL